MIRLLISIAVLLPALHAKPVAADQPSDKGASPPCDGTREAFGTRGFSASSAPKPPEVLLSLTRYPDHSLFSRQVNLGPLDVQGLQLEDELNSGAGLPRRVGVGRPAEVFIEDGVWHPLESGGALWTVAVRCEAAVGIRLRFSAFNLPEDASVRLASPARSDAVDGPYQGAGPFDDGEFWSTVLVGEIAYLEYHDPRGGPTPPAALPFLVDQVQHLYRDPFEAVGPPREGDCHNDVTCEAAWSDVRDAVAIYTYMEGPNSYSCTGQLLDTVIGDQTPYFLTAAHCIATEIAARSMVFYWKYQTDQCGGVPPALASVPSSSLGQLLAGDFVNDMSLVMAIGELPADLFWAGWNGQPVTGGTSLACIHHPDGAYKRISFGAKTGEQDGMMVVEWTSGVTEMGSSGAGAYLDSTHQLVGTLFGGPSSCMADPEERYDLFGAFEYTCPQFGPFLQAGSDDAWEPNGMCTSAPLIAPGVYGGLIVKSTDEDWYRLSSTSCGGLSATVRFTDAHGDIDLELYDACAGALLAESRGTGNTERIDYEPGAAGEFWLRVYLSTGTRNKYEMTVTLDGVNALYHGAAGIPIPDNNPTGIQHTIFVPDHFTITDLDVGLVIAHTWNGDLRVRLSHQGTNVWLIDRPGRDTSGLGFNNDGFDIILDDSAATAIETHSSGGPTVIGTFRPNEPLAAFNGQDVYGSWTISVMDVEFRDTGTLKEWRLYVVQAPPGGDPCECGGDGDTTGDGNTDLADLAAMQRCFTGMGAGSVPSGCAGSNFDCDSDVDLEDVDYLISVLTGPRQGGASTDPPGGGPVNPGAAP